MDDPGKLEPKRVKTPRDHDLIAPLYEAEGYDGAIKTDRLNPKREEPAVEFAWDEVEAPLPDPPDVLADRVVSDCLAWVMSFCLSGAQSLKTRGAQSVAFRRFVALAYIYRPDLIKGRTIREIAAEIEVSHQAVNRYISEISIQLGASGVNQQGVNYRLACRLRQLRDRTRPSDPPPDPPA